MTVTRIAGDVDLSDWKTQVKALMIVEHDDRDARIELLLNMAIGKAEDQTGRLIGLGTFVQTEDCWRARISIEAAPVHDVTAVRYRDSDGVTQTVDAAAWSWSASGAGATVTFASSFACPALGDGPSAIEIEFEGGYATVDDESPPMPTAPYNLRGGVFLMVKAWFDDEVPEGDIPRGAINMLSGARIFR